MSNTDTIETTKPTTTVLEENKKNSGISTNDLSCPIDNNKTAKQRNKQHPRAFLCPITMEVMKDPVMDCDGNTYERENILQWTEKHSTSPITGSPLQTKHLVPNRALREMIYRFMGPIWSKEAEKSIKEVPEAFNPLRRGSFVGTNDNNNDNRNYRGTIDGFLEEISRSIGKNIRLNDQGIGAFTYEHLTFVIEVPESVGSLFIYTSFSDPETEDQSASTAAIYEKALRMNYIQQETRGACLSLDPLNNQLILSYMDRISHVNSTDLRNILENFIDAAMELNKELKDTEESAASSAATAAVVINE